MFDLVADVERYPEFVPLCQSLKVRQRTPGADGTEVVIADMTVSFKLVRESFTSRVTLDRPNQKITVEYLRHPVVASAFIRVHLWFVLRCSPLRAAPNTCSTAVEVDPRERRDDPRR